jgi:hypothetical protein
MSPETPKVSALHALSQAIEDVRARLFPFRLEFWLILGLCSFLEQCGSGGRFPTVPTFPSQGGGGSYGHGGDEGFSEITSWVSDHILLIMLGASIVLAVVVVFMAIATWIGSQGTFLYIEGVARGETDITRAFKANKDKANSFFAFRFVLGLVVLLSLLTFLAMLFLLFAASASDSGPGSIAVAALFVVVALAAFALIFGSSLLGLVLRDFVAPIQWAEGRSCLEALRAFGPLLARYPGEFLIYFFVKLAVGVLTGFVMLATCCFCCLAFVPVVGQTLLQPILFFERAWSLRFLEQMGYRTMGGLEPPAPPPSPPPLPLTLPEGA